MDQGDWMGIATLLAFIAFIGVCVWAWSDKRKAGFEEAANLRDRIKGLRQKLVGKG